VDVRYLLAVTTWEACSWALIASITCAAVAVTGYVVVVVPSGLVVVTASAVARLTRVADPEDRVVVLAVIRADVGIVVHAEFAAAEAIAGGVVPLGHECRAVAGARLAAVRMGTQV
jgi:hypothetical protein